MKNIDVLLFNKNSQCMPYFEIMDIIEHLFYMYKILDISVGCTM